MRVTIVAWGVNFRTGTIGRQDAWQALTLTFTKKLEYPLLPLTLTDDECDNIMKPVFQVGLTKSGLSRNIPSALLYGMKKNQELGSNKLHTIMGINQI